MKKVSTIFTILLALTTLSASAQVSVESATPQQTPEFENKVKTDSAQPAFSSAAKARAERAAIRKERNTIEFNIGINGSLSNFNSKWQDVNGSVNSITGIGNILFTHSFNKGKFTIDNKFTGKLGATSKSSVWTKSQDEWFISTAPAYKISDKWNFGAIVSLRSQFANGVDSKNVRTSSCFAPAYLNVSVGFTYVCPNPKVPIKINLSPISMNATYVTNDTVKNAFFNKQGFKDDAGNPITYNDYKADHSLLDAEHRNTAYCYGLTLNNGSSRYEGGSSVQIDFDRTFGKSGVFRYRTTFYGFYGWINEIAQQTDKEMEYAHLLPTMRWEHTVDIKATKYLSTQFYFQMYYNKAQVNSLQTQIILGVGLSYTFKNK